MVCCTVFICECSWNPDEGVNEPISAGEAYSDGTCYTVSVYGISRSNPEKVESSMSLCG